MKITTVKTHTEINPCGPGTSKPFFWQPKIDTLCQLSSNLWDSNWDSRSFPCIFLQNDSTWLHRFFVGVGEFCSWFLKLKHHSYVQLPGPCKSQIGSRFPRRFPWHRLWVARVRQAYWMLSSRWKVNISLPWWLNSWKLEVRICVLKHPHKLCENQRAGWKKIVVLGKKGQKVHLANGVYNKIMPGCVLRMLGETSGEAKMLGLNLVWTLMIYLDILLMDQLRLVVYPIIYRVLYIQTVVGLGISEPSTVKLWPSCLFLCEANQQRIEHWRLRFAQNKTSCSLRKASQTLRKDWTFCSIQANVMVDIEFEQWKKGTKRLFREYR